MWSAPLTRACGWVDARLDQFRIARSPESLIATLKAVSELAVAATFLCRHRDPTVVGFGDRWMTHAWREVGAGELFLRMVDQDARFVPVAMSYVPFHVHGLRNPRLREALAARIDVAEMDLLTATLTVAAARGLGITPSEPTATRARALSVLALRPPPADMPHDAAYVLAHECFFATAWGTRAPAWDAATARYVDDCLPRLVDRFCAAPDTDALAELVLATHVTGDRCAKTRAWAVLTSAQTARGEVVGTVEPTTMFPRKPHPTLTRSYHTTLGAIMAWAACDHGDEPRRTTSGGASVER